MIRSKHGFSLIETLIGLAIFTVISTLVINGFVKVIEGNKVIRSRTIALNILNEELEIIKNIPFNNIGVENSIPDGPLQRVKILELDGYQYVATTTVKNIDNSVDGTLGGNPGDEFPIDSKLVEMEISCISCDSFTPITYTKYFYPETLEDLEGGGAIEIKTFDAYGEPLSGINIHIENNQQNPVITIDDTTDLNGTLRILGLATGTEAYEITVSKSGYSTDMTYATGDVNNPVPNKTHVNVLDNQFSQISFSLDKLSTINIETKLESCSTVPNADIGVRGAKEIGYQTLKYNETITTNYSGLKTLSNMEWDTYSFVSEEASYYLVGSNPNSEMELNPDVEKDIELILRSADPNGITIQVVDSGTRLPLSDATVILKDSNSIVIDTQVTGLGSLSQTDWSGSAGQQDYIDHTRYLSQDGNVETVLTPGEMKLVLVGSDYVGSAQLESSTFDTGTTSVFHTINWEPASQTAETGPDSVRFQVASAITNSATTTWSYIGPDGTGVTYYTSAGATLHSSHSNDQYFRYKVFLETDDVLFTPNISDVGFVYSSNCIPTGEILFDNLTAGTDYEVEIQKNGYFTKIDVVDVNAGWQLLRVLLTEN